ncbi:hypothetical protein [Xanthomonas euroxanthea]|uniref:hypothetical protein n=1 Tax=Xanthomonas euroxanthea TaxID=2259622 RepID=UPI001611A28A|nr:hypothetical protein [Xanthomonas euroxanthea]MBB5769133.1 hypothetical protein [Xanthomonas euroxanthea]
MSELSHRPHHPPRNGMIPEPVFAELWEKQMRGYDDEGDPAFAVITRDIPPTQELASLVASFVTWLGTNVGMRFLSACRKQSALRGSDWYGDGYLAAWAIENHRRAGHCYGWRMIEMLAWVGDWNTTDRHHPPLLTADAYEVVENLVCWLGATEGQKFIALCEATILARQMGIRPDHLAALRPLIDQQAGPAGEVPNG